MNPSFTGTEPTRWQPLVAPSLEGIIAMSDPTPSAVIELRLKILSDLDTSANVSFLERSQMRLRVFAVVGAVDRRAMSPSTALSVLEDVRRDVSALVDR